MKSSTMLKIAPATPTAVRLMHFPVIRGFQIDSTVCIGDNCKDKGNAVQCEEHDAEVTSYCEPSTREYSR